MIHSCGGCIYENFQNLATSWQLVADRNCYKNHSVPWCSTAEGCV